MARIRYLKPEFFFDDDLAELKFEARLFFQGLWCYADREGRLEDKPKVLKAQIMPYDSVNIEKIMESLNDKFITRYEIGGRKYIQIKNFLKHQSPHHTEKKSTIPENNGSVTVKVSSSPSLKEKEKEKEKEKGAVKQLHFEFIYLLPKEFEKLKKKWPLTFNDRIEKADLYAKQIGLKKFKAKYDSHYACILNWNRDAPAEAPNRPTHNELPMKRTARSTNTPESKALVQQMNKLAKERPEGWQSKLKSLQKESDDMKKNINSKSLGEVLKEGGKK